MNALIIEDEPLTAERIRTLLLRIDPGIRVLSIIDSVKTAVQWFNQNEKPDLVFMDIQLADGLSFDIFDQVKIDYPVIFLTAFQEYAIKAFKVNSVDYLLKPISEEDLRSSLTKYQRYFARDETIPAINNDLLQSIKQMISKPFKSRFMVRVGDRIKTLDVNEILYFYSLDKGTYLHTSENRNYVIDFTLDALCDLLDPDKFFRLNRRYISTHKAIRDLIHISGSKIKVSLADANDDNIFVSRDKLTTFKEWLDR